MAASGKSLAQDQICETPGDISEKDAAILIGLHAAALVPPKGMEDAAGQAEDRAQKAEETGEQKAEGADGASAKKPALSEKRNAKKGGQNV